MKKILIFGLLAFLGFAPHVFAQGFTALAPIPGLTDQSATSVINSATLAAFFNNLYKYLIGLAATLAVIEIIWGGLQISTQDSVSKQGEGRERITQAIFGLVLVLSPVLVFSIINPSILDLSLNLPSLKLDTPAVTSSTGTGDTAAATAAGCSASLNQGVVNCPTQVAANAFAATCSNNTGQTYLSNDPSYPYSASCNALLPFQGSQSYTDKALIPTGYWCYLTKISTKTNPTDIFYSGSVLTYICSVSKDSCSALALHPIGTYAGDCRLF